MWGGWGCVYCVGDSEQRESGVGSIVNDIMMSETLKVVGLVEAAGRSFWFRKKPMNLCTCDRKECEYGVGAGVNGTMLSETLYETSLLWIDKARAK